MDGEGFWQGRRIALSLNAAQRGIFKDGIERERKKKEEKEKKREKEGENRGTKRTKKIKKKRRKNIYRVELLNEIMRETELMKGKSDKQSE